MRYDAAPMEGLTDRVWRQAHQHYFGGADRYYAPFISPPENRVPIKKKMAELAPQANPGALVIPQLLAKDGSLAAWMIGLLRREMGYTEVNLNLGCPSGTVTAKGKGSGMLRDLGALDRFLYTVFDEAGGPISVKTRIGVTDPEEFGPILEVYNRYPLAELIIHPRVRPLQRGAAGLSHRTVHRLHRRLRQRHGGHQPDERLLARMHRPLCRHRKAGKAAAKAAGALGIRGDGGSDLHPAPALTRQKPAAPSGASGP